MNTAGTRQFDFAALDRERVVRHFARACGCAAIDAEVRLSALDNGVVAVCGAVAADRAAAALRYCAHAHGNFAALEREGVVFQVARMGCRSKTADSCAAYSA